jgi:hypothetical protein
MIALMTDYSSKDSFMDRFNRDTREGRPEIIKIGRRRVDRCTMIAHH